MTIVDKVVRVPVRCVDGQWELLYGGGVKVKEGGLAELRINKALVEDKQLLMALTKKSRVKILDEGTELRIALTIQPGLASPLVATLLERSDTKHCHTAKISADSRFVAVTLGGPGEIQKRRKEADGGLWVVLEGMEPRELEAGIVHLPQIDGLDQAISVNHAFTLLSELFEPWRKSHTGNIYERVFYRDGQMWYPLGDLRKRALCGAERDVISDLWKRIEEELGQVVG